MDKYLNMQYSQTGNTLLGSRKNQTTSGNGEFLLKCTILHLENDPFIKPSKANQTPISAKETELSPDEEEKFYKKVFKTSLN